MSLVLSLYSYRERPARSPREDFLTELLGEFLGELESSKLSAEGLRRLLGIPCRQASLDWTTQHVIPSTFGSRLAKLRPDIVGRGTIDGESAVVLVENKIGAGYTIEEGSPDAPDGQVVRYREYLRLLPERRKFLRLITHLTPAPSDLSRDSVIRWDSMYRCLNAWQHDGLKSEHAIPAYLSNELIVFLGACAMGPVDLTLVDIASYGNYSKLKTACKQLGDAYRVYKETPSIGQKLSNCGFGVVHGNSMGHFREPEYFGNVIFTPRPQGVESWGRAAGDSKIIVWLGVLVGPVYDVSPRVRDVPEFNSGIGIWGKESALREETAIACWSGIASKLFPETTPELTVRARENGNGLCVIGHSRSFLDVVDRGEVFRDAADAFYRDSLSRFARLSDDEWKSFSNWTDSWLS